MKKIYSYIAIILFLGINQSSSQNIPISNFYDKYKYEENTTKISLPGWIVRFGALIARKAADDKETKETLKLAKKIRFLKVLQIEDSNPVSAKDIKCLTQKLKRRKFEPLLYIRDGGTRTQVMVKERNGLIRNFFLLTQEEDSFTMVSIKMRLHIKDVNKVIRMLNDEHDIPIAKAQ